MATSQAGPFLRTNTSHPQATRASVMDPLAFPAEGQGVWQISSRQTRRGAHRWGSQTGDEEAGFQPLPPKQTDSLWALSSQCAPPLLADHPTSSRVDQDALWSYQASLCLNQPHKGPSGPQPGERVDVSVPSTFPCLAWVLCWSCCVDLTNGFLQQRALPAASEALPAAAASCVPDSFCLFFFFT